MTALVRQVIKLGGRAQQSAELARALAAAWAARPGELCVVHGGGDEITALQRKLGGEPSFAGGRRVTTASDVELVRMALSGSANKRLVSQLAAAGAPAVGVSGEDGGLIGAEPLGVAEFGHVGMPARINRALLRALLAGGFLPVISPLGRDVTSAECRALNVNGDDAAAAIAVAAGAAELLFVADVAGVCDASGYMLPMLDVETAREMAAAGVIGGGMSAKLEAAHVALAGGVERVRIGDANSIGDTALGTVVTPAPSGMALR